MLRKSLNPRVFAVSGDGSATKVSWRSEFADERLAACDLYERALDIEAADHLAISFKKEEDGSYIAAIYQKAPAQGQLENVLCLILDLDNEQKNSLKDFSIFVREAHATIKRVRVRSFQGISRVRLWRTYRHALGWEQLNACEMDVLDALQKAAS